MSQTSTDRYRIEGQIGSGGMATVYKGVDTLLARPVALKVLDRRVDPEIEALFQAEARAVASLNHPNIVTVYDVGEWDGTAYIAMEYIAGPDLKRYIQERGPLPPDEAFRIISQVGSALSHAHTRGVVHCDIKPQNILLSAGGEAKLADFGIAQARLDSGQRGDGKVYGTPLYIAPEQLAGGDVGPRTDVHGLGLVLWEALTGKEPRRVPPDGRVWLDEPHSRLPSGVLAVVRRATAPEPAARYASIDERVRDLEAKRGGVGANQTTVAHAPGLAPSRPRALPRWAVLPVVVLLLLLGWAALRTMPVLQGGEGAGKARVVGTPNPAAAANPVGIISTPTVTTSPGVRVAQLTAPRAPVRVRVNEDGREREFVLGPGEYREVRGTRYLRVGASPASQLQVTVDGERLGTLLEAASRLSGRDIVGPDAYIEYGDAGDDPAVEPEDDSVTEDEEKGKDEDKDEEEKGNGKDEEEGKGRGRGRR